MGRTFGTTESGLVIPAGHMATPAGIVVQKRERFVCRYCGAVHGVLKGVELHESQCREQARSQWTAAALSGPAATAMTPEQIHEYVGKTIKAHESRERTVWTEMGDSSY